MFFLLIPFALALLVVSVLGFAGIGPLTDERRAEREGILGGVGAAVGLLVGAGLLVVAVVLTVGLAGVAGEDDTDAPTGSRADPPAGSLPPATAGTASTTPPVPLTAPAEPIPGPRVRLEAPGDDQVRFPLSYDVADGLTASSVLSVLVVGFEPFAAAIAEQCVSGAAPRCANLVPVQFDERGEARFQYLVSDDFLAGDPVPGGCRSDAAPCTIVVRSSDDEGGQETRASIQTVFASVLAPPGRIEATPSSGLSLDGEPVTVEVRDYPPGATFTAMLCAAPDAYGRRCGAPGPTATVEVGPDGTGSATLVVVPGAVGAEGAPCERGDVCGITVVSDDVFVRAPVVPITFAAPPGAAYDPLRLALGLVLAALLLAAAAVLLVRTDWESVGEAAAPEIDDAEYADLDAIIAALPPEEEEAEFEPA